MNAIKIDYDRAYPNLEVARRKFDLSEAEKAAQELEQERISWRKEQKELYEMGIIRFQHLAHESAKKDITNDIGGNFNFDRDCVSDWVRAKDDDPKLAIEIRTAQNCTKSSLDKPISISSKPRSVEVQIHLIDKENGHELKPETIYRSEGYRIEQSVDDIRNQIEIVPGMEEWEEFNDLLTMLEDHFGVKKIDPKTVL